MIDIKCLVTGERDNEELAIQELKNRLNDTLFMCSIDRSDVLNFEMHLRIVDDMNDTKYIGVGYLSYFEKGTLEDEDYDDEDYEGYDWDDLFGDDYDEYE